MRTRIGPLVLAAGLALGTLSGCGGSPHPDRQGSTSTTTSTTTTALPVDYPMALTQRLAKELDDSAVAGQVVERLGSEFVANMEAKIPLGLDLAV